MSRFTGFQNERGVAVLDTVTGELVFYPFDGGAPSPLRAPTAAPSGEGDTPFVLPVARPSDGPTPAGGRLSEAGLRAARRLDGPRPMVISYPGADEIALIKAARLARSLDPSVDRGGSASQDEE